MCGYRVGLYTSPHLVDFSERIRVNGQPISEEYVTEFIEKEKSFFEPLKPSFFELTTAMAFKYFAEMDVDIAVIEVGLGGRLDCTNIITPALSVITNIGFDHMKFLGNSLEQIATEKAGIIKKNVPVVIGETTPETRVVFDAFASELHAPIVFAEDNNQIVSAQNGPTGYEYKTKDFGIIKGELCGSYQEKNTNTILCAVQQLEALGYMHACKCEAQKPCMNIEVSQGFQHVCSLTGLKGRWQKIGEAPLTICDTGHNVPGWTYLSEQLKAVKCNHMHIVFGMVDDKDIQGVMALLPKNATYYFTKASNKRAVSESVLKLYAQTLGLEGETYPDVKTAYDTAKAVADNNDFVFVGGSSYVVADLLKNCI
jgi:dihydrofolate synthase/folylpolyglutamate synthase